MKAEPSTAHTREPRQVRKEATVSGSLRVLEEPLAGASCSGSGPFDGPEESRAQAVLFSLKVYASLKVKSPKS